MFSNDVPLEINSPGHYYITIKPSKLPHEDLEMILISDIINKNNSSKKNIAIKLHRQFSIHLAIKQTLYCQMLLFRTESFQVSSCS